MIISLDTETTGLDFQHGAKPYLVTIAKEDGEQFYWQWSVDPITREPNVDPEDLEEIQKEIDEAELLILHNAVFDVRALGTIFEDLRWDWGKTRDTIISAHIVNSKTPKNLTTQVLTYLHYDLKPFEDRIEAVTNRARSICRGSFPDWNIAKRDRPDMPSAKEKVWKFDMWLPDVLLSKGVEVEGADDDLIEYALSDTAATLPLYKKHLKIIEDRELTKIYEDRLQLQKINYDFETTGITINAPRKRELEKQYRIESIKAGAKCKKIAKSTGFDLELPAGGVNNSLREYFFEHRKYPVVKETKKGNPSLDSDAMDVYLATTEGKDQEFISSLSGKRSRDTALTYMGSYERFWIPSDYRDWFRLYPSLNPCGTDTLRWSSNNPNEQNISKKKGFNLRYCFGPEPGREWWAIDYDNLELRIPAYECEEPAMLELFENPENPPYFGSYHLLIFSILHPDKYDRRDDLGLVKARDKYKSTWYQWTKNGNFAEMYGAIEESGTADRAFKIEGAQRIVAERLKKKSKLNESWIQYAKKNGYVETMPDREVDPNRGYPLVCSRDDRGKIKPTVPLNYHVQGTACWIAYRAMVKIQEFFNKLSGDYRMIMNVHDEIVFDFPKKPNYGNLPIIRKVLGIMEERGDSIGVPLTCGVTYHEKTWSEGIDLSTKELAC